MSTESIANATAHRQGTDKLAIPEATNIPKSVAETPLTNEQLSDYLNLYIDSRTDTVDDVILVFEFSFHALSEPLKSMAKHHASQQYVDDSVEFFIQQYLLFYRSQNLHPPAITLSSEIPEIIGLPGIDTLFVIMFTLGKYTGNALSRMIHSASAYPRLQARVKQTIAYISTDDSTAGFPTLYDSFTTPQRHSV